MREKTRYLFNRNAATHRDAIVRFSLVAGVAAGVSAMVIPLAMMPVDRTPETYKAATIAGAVILVVVWLVVFMALCWVYYALNELQFHTPPPYTEKRNIEFYVNGEKAPPELFK